MCCKQPSKNQPIAQVCGKVGHLGDLQCAAVLGQSGQAWDITWNFICLQPRCLCLLIHGKICTLASWQGSLHACNFLQLTSKAQMLQAATAEQTPRDAGNQLGASSNQPNSQACTHIVLHLNSQWKVLSEAMEYPCATPFFSDIPLTFPGKALTACIDIQVNKHVSGTLKMLLLPSNSLSGT